MALWKDGWNFPLAAFGGWRLYNQGRIWQILFEPTDMITLIIIITIVIITNVIINRSQVKRWTTSPKWYQSKLGHVFVKRVNFSGEVLQIYVLNQFQGVREEKATFNWTILATAAECRRRRKMVATYRNIIKSWPDLPSIMMMKKMITKKMMMKRWWC